MSFPLEKLVSRKGNVYELTCAAIKRARQITMAGDEEIEQENYKIVAGALAQLLDEKVSYRLKE